MARRLHLSTLDHRKDLARRNQNARNYPPLESQPGRDPTTGTAAILVITITTMQLDSGLNKQASRPHPKSCLNPAPALKSNASTPATCSPPRCTSNFAKLKLPEVTNAVLSAADG
jgi:hypothetical protein